MANQALVNALNQVLPPDQRHLAASIADGLLAAAAGDEAARQRLEEPELHDVVRALAGKTFPAGGGDQITIGAISNSKGIAAGAGSVALSDVVIHIHQAGPTYAEPPITVGANAQATVIRNMVTIFGAGSGRGNAVNVSLIVVVIPTSVLLSASLSSPAPSPVLGALAFFFVTICVVLGVVQFRLQRPPPDLERGRGPLLRRMRSWVEQQLGTALEDTYHMALGLVARPDAIVRPYDSQETALAVPVALPAGTTAAERFHAQGGSGSLIILGAPGSGKTTALLELARDLIAAAERDARLPIPVVFKLASWDDQRWGGRSPALADWLVYELDSQYQIAQEVGRALLAADKIVPLLDGLDDIKLVARREACVEAINGFRRERQQVGLLVTCRTVEYEELGARLRLDDAVEVQPLTDAQIDAYLEHGGAPLAGLRADVAGDPALCELVRAPLILAIMARIYPDVGSPLALGAGAPGEPGGLHGQLFGAYIEQRLALRTSGPVERARMRDGLIVLARGMLQHAQHVFHIERLQATWLRSRRDKVTYTLLDRAGGGLVVALVVGLVVGLSYGLGRGLSYGWLSGVVLGVANGLRFGLVGGLVIALLGRTGEALEQSRGNMSRRLRRAVLGALVFGAFGGLFAFTLVQVLGRVLAAPMDMTAGDLLPDVLFFALVGAIGGVVVHGPDVRPRRVQIVENRRWSWWRGLPVAVPVGLAVSLFSIYLYSRELWLVFGLVYGVSVWILLGITAGEVGAVARPNQGIWRSARSAARVGLSVGLMGGLSGIFGGFLVGAPLYGLVYGLSSAALVGVFGAVVSGLYPCVSHLALRIVLWRSGALPWNLAAFLDDAAQRIILRRAGGGYTFVHRLLLEYVAGLPLSGEGAEELG